MPTKGICRNADPNVTSHIPKDWKIDALLKYGKHETDCHYWDLDHHCSCGFEAVLELAVAEREKP